MNVILEFLVFLKHRKKYWLWPLFIILIILAAVIFVAQGSVLGPFIYSLF